MLLTDSPLQFSPLVGSRDQSRSIDCRKCQETQGISTKLLHPTALTVSNDGTIYIGDLNIIWLYQPATGLTKPVLELTEQYAYKYYLTTDPVDGRLYITDNARRQIIRLVKIDSIENLRENYEIVVGDGQFCTLDVGNNVTCGDELLAKDVSLSYPKGLTIDRYGTMYFIDGQRIRKLSIDTSRVTHLAGSFEYQFDYQRQLSCNRTYALDQVWIRDSIEGWLKSLLFSSSNSTIQQHCTFIHWTAICMFSTRCLCIVSDETWIWSKSFSDNRPVVRTAMTGCRWRTLLISHSTIKVIWFSWRSRNRSFASYVRRTINWIVWISPSMSWKWILLRSAIIWMDPFSWLIWLRKRSSNWNPSLWPMMTSKTMDWIFIQQIKMRSTCSTVSDNIDQPLMH